MKLFTFFRSGTSHRLRIALRLKGLEIEYLPSRGPAHRAARRGRVPAPVHDDKVLFLIVGLRH